MVTKKTTKTAEKAEDTVETVTYSPKNRIVLAFQLGTKQPDWFKEALKQQDVVTTLPAISDPLHYDVEVNDDITAYIMTGNVTKGTFKAGDWIVSDVDGINGYSEEEFEQMFEVN